MIKPGLRLAFLAMLTMASATSSSARPETHALESTQLLQESPASADGPYQSFGYEWENNHLGLQRVVPEPWTPVRLAATGVHVWGREYELGGGLLPSQITSQGERLLASAPTLELRIDGSTERFDEEIGVVEAADDRVEWAGDVGGDGFVVRYRRLIEYDGFLRVDVEILPERPVRLERLLLSIPFRSETALFFSRYIDYDFEAQRLDHGSFVRSYGRLDKPRHLEFNPAVWIGNHEVGLEWVCETNYGWSPLRARSITIAPHGDTVLMTVHVVSQPVRLEAPYRFSFALYPTPVKPLRNDWRQIRLMPGGDAVELPNRASKLNFVEPRMRIPMRFPGLPEIDESRTSSGDRRTSNISVTDVRPQIRSAGASLIPYGTLYAMPARLPNGEWRHYARFWRTEHPRGTSRYPRWAASMGLSPREPALVYISVYPKSFQDFLVYQYVQAIDDDDIDGLYLDLASPNFSSLNSLHPYAEHVRNGGAFFPLFRHRELMKRLYVATKAKKADFLIIQHAAKLPVVVSGFSDVILSGEPLNLFFRAPGWTRRRQISDTAAYHPDYGRLPKELYEIQYAQTRGFVNMLLPETIKWDNDLLLRREFPQLLDRFTYTLVTRAVLYDTPLRISRMNTEIYKRVLRAQERFGWMVGVEFIGPWESAQFLGVSAGVDASVYLKEAENRIMVVLANIGDKTVKTSVSLNRKALAAAGVNLPTKMRVTDATTGAAVHLSGGQTLSLEPDRFRLLIVE